jgi:ferritin-like metal-binding protein YciE
MAVAFTFYSNHRLNQQRLFEECFEVLGEAHNENVFGAIERLVAAGEQVGFSAHDLIRMLRGGMTLETVLDVIEIRMTGACAQG